MCLAAGGEEPSEVRGASDILLLAVMGLVPLHRDVKIRISLSKYI